jgi:hypothetical protein
MYREIVTETSYDTVRSPLELKLEPREPALLGRDSGGTFHVSASERSILFHLRQHRRHLIQGLHHRNLIQRLQSKPVPCNFSTSNLSSLPQISLLYLKSLSSTSNLSSYLKSLSSTSNLSSYLKSLFLPQPLSSPSNLSASA